jgi:hypothetical protein
MNKILSVLLILFTTLVSNAQNGPTEGTLGSQTKREYVQIETTSNFDILLDDTGEGETHIRTEVIGGIVEKIRYMTNDVRPENRYDVSATQCGFYTRLAGNSGTVRVTVKWTTKGNGELRFTQENSVDCFDDTYSVYYAKIIERPYFTFGLGGLVGGCAGEEGTLKVFFGGYEEWAVDETRSFSLLGYKGQKIEHTLVKGDVKTSREARDLGFRYVYDIKLTSPIDFKQDEEYIITTAGTSVVMKNGANINNNILKVINRDTRRWMINSIPEENPIKHN